MGISLASDRDLQGFLNRYKNTKTAGITTSRVYDYLTVTANNGAHISTSVTDPFGGNDGVGDFDGTDDYLNSSKDAAVLNGADFTFKFKIRFTAFNTQWNTIISRWSGGGPFILDWDSTNNRLQFTYTNGSGQYSIYSSATTISLNTWYDMEVARSGSSLYYFRDGVLISTSAISGTIVDDSKIFRIAASGNGNNIHGQISDLHISKGIARHTSNFTPSTEMDIEDKYTALLLPMTGTDGSTTFTDGNFHA